MFRIDTLIPNPDALKPALRKLGIATAFGFLTFAIAQPYAILDLPYYAADAYQQSQMVRRVIDFPYTRQYDGSLPFAYHLWQFSVWGVGLPLAVLMWAGLGFTALRAALKRTRTDILLLAWFLPFFLITGLAEVKFPPIPAPGHALPCNHGREPFRQGPHPAPRPSPKPQLPVRGWGGRAGDSSFFRHGLLLVRLCQCPTRMTTPAHPSLGLCQRAYPSRLRSRYGALGGEPAPISIRTAA